MIWNNFKTTNFKGKRDDKCRRTKGYDKKPRKEK